MNRAVMQVIIPGMAIAIFLLGAILSIGQQNSPVGSVIKVTTSAITDVTSRFVQEITSRFLAITGKPTSTASFELGANAAPALSSLIGNQSWIEDTNVTLDLSSYFSDPDGDDLDFTLNFSLTNASQITISISNSTNTANLTPAKDWYGVGYIVFIATDGSLMNQSNNITLNVTPVNDAPSYNGSMGLPHQRFLEDTNLSNAFNISTFFSDVEGSPLTFSAVGNASVRVNITRGNVSLLPARDFAGKEYIAFTASDGENTTQGSNITIIIDPAPDLDTALFGGATTSLAGLTAAQLQSVAAFTVENTSAARVSFISSVNLTESDINFSDRRQFILTHNEIFINSTLLSALNHSANVTFYNLTFSNPQILRDGEVCSSSICAELSYASGSLLFNVSHFSSYTARETPTTPSPSPSPSGGEGGGGSGGGGGGGGALPITEEPAEVSAIDVSPGRIKASLKPGERQGASIRIRNLLQEPVSVNLDSSMNEYIFIFDTSFTLGPGQARTVQLLLDIDKDVVPNAYVGEITVIGGPTVKQIPVIIEVESEESLFDVNVEVLEKYKEVLPGEDVFAQIQVFNLKEGGRIDIDVEYTIRDVQGMITLGERETLAIDTQVEFVRDIRLPRDIAPGAYVFAVKIVRAGTTSVSTDVFEVKKAGILEFASGISPATVILGFTSIALIVCIVFGLLAFLRILEAHHHGGRRERKAQRGAGRAGRARQAIRLPSITAARQALAAWLDPHHLRRGEKQMKKQTKMLPAVEREISKKLRLLEQSKEAGLISEEKYQDRKEELELQRMNLR